MSGQHITSEDGSAWLWLKSELGRRLGEQETESLFSAYYEKLHLQYLEKRRARAAVELEELRQKKKAAELERRPADVRKYERMIESRERLLGA